jgi:hypothetical protein
MVSHPQPSVVQVICDLRQYNIEVNDIGTMEEVWQQIDGRLIGQRLVPGKPLSLALADGNVMFWIVDAAGVMQIEKQTNISIVDVLRDPKLLYLCQVCNEYGPLRCVKCLSENTPRGQERLCSDHAHFIKDEFTVFCPRHIPTCECRLENCQRPADFRCAHCRRLFSSQREHGIHKTHPHDHDIDYCKYCYHLLFDPCQVCEAEGRTNLGKSYCAFTTRLGQEPCARRLCGDHSFQWKIWGAHNSGVTLCDEHRRQLGEADPANLLYMMLAAAPPRRARYQPFVDIFYTLRILNRNRDRKAARLSPRDLERALNRLAQQTIVGESVAQEKHYESNYEKFLHVFQQTNEKIQQKEQEILTQVKAFYARKIGLGAVIAIDNVEIIERLSRAGQPEQYHVRIHLGTENKGPFIGPGGSIVKDLQAQCNINATF